MIDQATIDKLKQMWRYERFPEMVRLARETKDPQEVEQLYRVYGSTVDDCGGRMIVSGRLCK